MGNEVSEIKIEHTSLKKESKHIKKISAVIGPSGFRMTSASLHSAVSTPDVEEIDVDIIIDEIEEMHLIEQQTEELVHLMHEKAEKHGIIKGDFKYISDENMVSDITQIFTYRKQLGDGATCRVLLVHENKSNTKYALKEMMLSDRYNPGLFKKEIRLLTELNHPNILKYHQSYMDPHNFYIATQYLTGGDLYKRCKQYKTFTERIASEIVHTVVDAVAYMHNKGIVHRDLKPGNIVFDKPGPNGKLYIIDFGDSANVVDDEMYNEFVGTIYYLPPEITRYRHGWELKKGDTWAIGVITYQLLCGRYPFSGRNNREVIKKIKKEDFVWPSRIILSKYAKVFIRSLLRKNVHARLTAADALKDEWFAMAFDKDLGEAFSKTMDDIAKVAHCRYIMKNHLFSEMDDEEKKLVMDTFKKIDVENRGYVEEKQVVKHLIAMNMKEKYAKLKAKELFQTFDTGKTGKLTLHDLASSKTT